MQANDFDAVFDQAPGANLVLSTAFNIVAVSDDYLTATMTKRAQIVDRHFFDVFPDNPEDPTADGVRNLRASLQRVVDRGHRDAMAIQRYDVRTTEDDGGKFQERYWRPTNSPIVDRGGRLQYIVHQVEDVTVLAQTRRRLGAMKAMSERQDKLRAIVGVVRGMAVGALEPLAVIETSAFLLSKQSGDPQKLAKHLERIGLQVNEANRTITEMIATINKEQSLSRDDAALTSELATALEQIEQAAGPLGA